MFAAFVEVFAVVAVQLLNETGTCEQIGTRESEGHQEYR